MPRAASQSKTAEFDSLAKVARSVNENNDCAVKAISVACKTDYLVVRQMLTDAGRQPNRSTPWYAIDDVIDRLGYKRVWVSEYDFIRQYPKGHRDVLRNVTTHHPDRFPAAWQDGKTYLMSTGNHILAIVNGVNHDWTRGTARRCKGLWEVVRK